jgi:hypothetical protein
METRRYNATELGARQMYPRLNMQSGFKQCVERAANCGGAT